ncbi:hypothetical protein PSP6_440070 [Paraburkholderia tropica]|nr:hypothetical protein PSP6_440070 [Paraburkholderia tropica]
MRSTASQSYFSTPHNIHAPESSSTAWNGHTHAVTDRNGDIAVTWVRLRMQKGEMEHEQGFIG